MARNLDKPNKPVATNPDGSLRKPDNIEADIYSLPSTRDITKSDAKRAQEKAEHIWMRFDQTQGTPNRYPKIVASILVPTGSKIKPRPTRGAKFSRQTKRAKNPPYFPRFEERLWEKRMKEVGKLIHGFVWDHLTQSEKVKLSNLTKEVKRNWPHWQQDTQDKVAHAFRCEMIGRIKWMLRVNKRWMELHEIIPEKHLRGQAESYIQEQVEKGKIRRFQAGGVVSYNL